MFFLCDFKDIFCSRRRSNACWKIKQTCALLLHRSSAICFQDECLQGIARWAQEFKDNGIWRSCPSLRWQMLVINLYTIWRVTMMVAEEFRWALHSGGRCGDDTIDTAAALSVGIGRFQNPSPVRSCGDGTKDMHVLSYLSRSKRNNLDSC